MVVISNRWFILLAKVVLKNGEEVEGIDLGREKEVWGWGTREFKFLVIWIHWVKGPNFQ